MRLLIIALVLHFCSIATTELRAEEKSALREIDSSKFQVYSTKGHPKAKGLDLTFKYPRGWIKEEGNRPNIVQKFISEDEESIAMAIIITKSAPGSVKISAQDLNDFFRPENLRGMLPDNATLVAPPKVTKVENLPAGLLKYVIEMERVGVTLFSRTLSLFFFHNNVLVQVQFLVSAKDGLASSGAKHYQRLEPLFLSMMNSIVLPQQWNKSNKILLDESTAIPISKPKRGLSMDDSSLTLPLAFLALWGLGLAPALIARYVVVRKPFSKKAASWIAAIPCALFFISLRALEAATTGGKIEARSGLVFWVLVFYLSRWIMTRGNVTESSS